MALLPHEIVETSQDVKAVVIWLHGLGANGHDFVSIVPHLKLPKDLGVRFIFPHAPHIPITINGFLLASVFCLILVLFSGSFFLKQ